jgi:hypothetical protein
MKSPGTRSAHDMSKDIQILKTSNCNAREIKTIIRIIYFSRADRYNGKSLVLETTKFPILITATMRKNPPPLPKKNTKYPPLM